DDTSRRIGSPHIESAAGEGAAHERYVATGRESTPPALRTTADREETSLPRSVNHGGLLARAYSCRSPAGGMLRRNYAARSRDTTRARRPRRKRILARARDPAQVPRSRRARVARGRLGRDGGTLELAAARHLGRHRSRRGHLRARVRDPAMARLVRRGP